MPNVPELVELNQIRLDDDLSYRELGEAVGVSYATLQDLLTSENPQPYDRTLHKIRRYLDARRERVTS